MLAGQLWDLVAEPDWPSLDVSAETLHGLSGGANRARAYYLLGRELTASALKRPRQTGIAEQQDAAIWTLAVAHRLAPQAAAYNELGAVLRARGRPEARAFLQKALKFTPQGFFWDEAYAKERILATLLADQPPAWRALRQPATRRLEGLVSLCVTAQLDAEPRHPEVLRRLRWFVGSLFMAMPEAPPVEEALSQSTLTPFCAEDILFGMRELVAKNEDGVSVLYFLKTVRPDERSNFLEPCEQRLFTPAAVSRCTRTSGPTSSSGSASRLARRRGSSRRRTSCSSSARGPPSAARP